MGNPEHKIKEAFTVKDSSTVFPGKDEMWGRLDKAMYNRKGVAGFWRAAAIFLGLLLTVGVFAGLSFKAKIRQEKLELKAENEQLQLTIDSLLTLPAKAEPETRVVEKVVYRDRPVLSKSSTQTSVWKEKYRQLQDSSETLLSSQVQLYKEELLQLQAELNTVKANFIAYKSNVENQREERINDPFQLKGERVELGVQKSPPTKDQEMELKVFPINFQGNRNNLNKSILKK